jgi:hypothetical protein
MIAIQKIGKSFTGALNYNLKKLNHPDRRKRAELLETNFTSLNPAQVKLEVDWIRQLRPSLSRYVYHTSLNFPKEEQAELSSDKLLAIAKDYLTGNGFTANQYAIFRHHDAEHPHLHLLVNRISFDGSVVSDSNNYKKSENILRSIERQYALVQVTGSKSTQVHAATKDELEMVIRTGKPSDKMLLQEKINTLLKQKNLSIPEFISKAEQAGIHFLFNQASTGRVTGITYFHNGFKIKGQALGNSFKCAELIKKINYEQVRDSKAISEANSRTRSIYGELTATTAAGDRNYRNGSDGFYTGSSAGAEYRDSQSTAANEVGTEDHPGRERSLEAGQDADIPDDNSPDFDYNRFDGISIEIADDEDDAKYRRRRRGMGR